MSSKLTWSSRVHQLVCGSSLLRCDRTVRLISKGFLLATSAVMHRNNRINTSSNSRFVTQNLTLVEKSLRQIGKKGNVQED